MILNIKKLFGFENQKKYSHPKKQTLDQKEDHWLEKAYVHGIQMNHPSYQPDEEYIMNNRGSYELRFSKAPHYLIMREALRRYIRGYNSHSNNYIKLAVRSFERMQDELLDDNSKELGETFHARSSSNSEYMNFTGKKSFGELNQHGEYWSPTFRRYYPYEEFTVIGRIDRLYTEWGQGTYKKGKEYGDVAAWRVLCKENGTAEAMILRHKLPVDKFMGKLTEGFISRKKK